MPQPAVLMRLLVIEDYEPLRESLAAGLLEAGYEVDLGVDGEDAWRLVRENRYDAIVLDRMLPRMDGLELLKRLRAFGDETPVLLLTALTTVEDRVAGLDAGADDYITKPFAVPELLARLRRLHRRSKPTTNALSIGSITIDPRSQSVFREGVEVELTPREWQVLQYLAVHRGKVVSRAELAEHLYPGTEGAASNVVDVLVARLRKKLHRDGECDVIRTRRGSGYLLDDRR